jgi:isoleucyl-tRNA synthetase
LPSNIALCVKEDLVYLQVENTKTKEIYYVGEARFDQMCKEVKWNKKEFKTLQKLTGKDLIGLSYEPLFP